MFMGSLIGHTMTIISVALGQSLYDLFGWESCIVYYFSYMICNLVLVVGGLGMTFFRFMIVRFPVVTHCKIGQMRLIRIILLSEAAIIG